VNLPPHGFKNSFLSLRLFLMNSLIFFTVRDLIGGVLTTFGIQPICFVISRRVAPCFPITRPGFSASIITSPESGQNSSSRLRIFWNNLFDYRNRVFRSCKYPWIRAHSNPVLISFARLRIMFPSSANFRGSSV